MPWTPLRSQINSGFMPSVIVTGTSRLPARPAATVSTRGLTGSPISWKIRNELVCRLQINVCVLYGWVVCVFESVRHTQLQYWPRLWLNSVSLRPSLHSFRIGHRWLRLCLCVLGVHSKAFIFDMHVSRMYCVYVCMKASLSVCSVWEWPWRAFYTHTSPLVVPPHKLLYDTLFSRSILHHAWFSHGKERTKVIRNELLSAINPIRLSITGMLSV